MILDQIVQSKRRQLVKEKKSHPLHTYKDQIKEAPPTRDFAGVLQLNASGIIAEVKRASPSQGVFRSDFDPLALARTYIEEGVACLSILTERDFFLGKDQYLADIRKISPLPILRKDFIIDPYQIYQSRALGADAILLIVSILTPDQLVEFQEIARSLGLQCLVEVHTLDEVHQAVAAGARLIGINNRDLTTFQTDLAVTSHLLPHIPPGIIVVSESGISTGKDAAYLKSLGAQGLLIGQALVESEGLAATIDHLKGGDHDCH